MGTVTAMSDEALADLIADLTRHGLTVATAESLTGGGLVARLVDVPGASHVVRGGACTYAVDTKAFIDSIQFKIGLQIYESRRILQPFGYSVVYADKINLLIASKIFKIFNPDFGDFTVFKKGGVSIAYVT